MKDIKVSEFIAKDIVAINNGQNIGYVLNICFDANLTKLVGFIVADEESERENFLSKQDVKIIGDDCIFVEEAYKLQLNYSGISNNPICKKVYDDKGCFLGVVLDVICDGLKPIKLITSICEIPINKIYSNGIDCLFFSDKKKRKKTTNNFSFTHEGLLPKVETQRFEIGANENKSKFQITNKKENLVINPSKVTLAPSALLNKTATCDVFGLNNELIIKKGQVINQGKIDKAKKHGKINLLILNSK